MTSCIDEFRDLQIEIGYDTMTRELNWIGTRGLAWYGYPELVAPIPLDHPGDPAAVAVFISSALVSLGRNLLELDTFRNPRDLPPYTADLVGDSVTVWVTDEDPLWSPLPAPVLDDDVFLVQCSLWADQPVE